MGDYWFTADQHFGHQAIIKHCNRPFKSIHEMDAALTVTWNNYVKKQDTIVVLGDFYWQNFWKMDQVLEWANAFLNGNKIFIKGNHDRWFTRNKKYMYNKKISDVHVWAGHYPLASWPSGINLHGHCHGKLEKHVNRFDVGVDTNREYRPYHFDEIKQGINWDVINRRNRENY